MDEKNSPEGGAPSDPESPKPLPAMAFTIDFNDGKIVDTQRYENLVKKSLARHQRVQSMSASWQRPSPAPQRKPPMSAKLPRKTRGYHSEGYFSSDQEDSFFAPSKQKDRTPKGEFFSPPGGDRDSFRKKNFSNDPPANTPTVEKRSPDAITSFMLKKSKSPIVDSIMSRSDVLPSRQALNLPLKQTHTASLNRVTPDNPSFNSISSYHIKSFSDRNLDDIPMIADTSSPELDLLTPDNTLLTPGTPLRIPLRSDLNIDDGNASPSSTVSEAGTYTIEADNYTEEQKAKMNIDDVFGLREFDEPIKEALNKIKKSDLVITKEPRSSFGSNIREELLLAKSIPDPIRKVSTDKNVLEISCCYESPTESIEPLKSVKSAKTYLDKIKSRVKNISEKTFQKPKTPENSLDVGSFTSVTASGVLCSVNQKYTKSDISSKKLSRKNSLTKSNIDSSEYVHRIPRDNLVCQNVSNDCFTPSQDNAKNSYQTPEQILVGKLSHLSLNRCQGDKSWIQEWAESVKKHNKETAMAGGDNMLAGLPPISPRHSILVKGITSPSKSITSPCDSPTKIPSPMSTLARQRATVPDILTSTPDTESYLQNTQNVISSLQAKLQNAKSSPLASMDHNIFHDKISKLPVSQLSRSNSLNYRLHRKTNSAENSPLRNPGNYLITGNYGMSSAHKLLLANLGASKSLDTESNLSPSYGDYYSPILASKFAKNNEEMLNRLRIEDLIKKQRSDHDLSRLNGRSHSRHHSYDDRKLQDDFNNANMTQSLNLQSNTKNIFEELNDRRAAHRTSINNINGQRMIDQTRNVLSPSNQRLQNIKLSHHRGFSDTLKNIQNHNVKQQDTQSSPIRRSSSFNVVNKNNVAMGSPLSRISLSGKTRSKMQTSCHNTPEVDCLSEDSDNISTGGFYSDYEKRVRKSNMNELLVGARCNRAFALRRARLESPDARSQQNISQSSPRCPGTPEMKRKFSNDLGKKPARAHSRDSRSIGPSVGRVSDVRPDVCQVQVPNIHPNPKNKKITETVKQSITNRLTRSSSAAKDFLPKSNEKDKKKPSKINMNVMNKEVEFSNWKKRASYDPMKAAQEAKKKTQGKTKNVDPNLTPQVKVEEMNSPSNSSPVHRSKSFNCTGTPIDERMYLLQQIQNEGSSDTDDFEDQLICTLPAEGSANAPILKMVSGADVESEIALKNAPDVTKRSKRLIQGNYIKLPTDFITKLQISQNVDPKKVQLADKRKTYLIDAEHHQLICDSLTEADKRRTFVLDSDTTTNSTTNGSGSRRNSSIYSDERVNNEPLSDSDGESDTEPVVNVVPRTKSRSVPPQQRHSGDFSMSSSTCSASKDNNGSSKKIQPRYMDISRFKSESSTSKNFLRRDPTKTYVGVLPVQDHRHQAKKIAAKQIEIEQKNRELEKWKRRASYDPRKAAAQAKQKPANNKSPSNSVLRSQSFHGPMTQNNKLVIHPVEKSTAEAFYQDISSDNEF